jgi:hypothetical protein
MTKFIELTDEFVDHIVANELKDIYVRNLDSADDEDLVIQDACEKLLMYILPPREARAWIIATRYPDPDTEND